MVIALINSGAQVSCVSSRFCEWMALKVYPLERLLGLEGTGGSAIPYFGYMEVNLQIPGIKGYNEGVLLLVILTTTHSKKKPVVVGSKIIDRVMEMITKRELARATVTWKQAHFSAVMSRLLQLPHKSVRGLPPLSPLISLCLRNSLWMMSRGISTPHRGLPFPHLGLSAYMATHVQGHCMWVHVLSEPAWGPSIPLSWF